MTTTRRGDVSLFRRYIAKIGLAVALLIGTAVLALTIWSLWPLPAHDDRQVCPQLSTLKTPYQSVQTVIFLDGGSIGMKIMDKDGRQEQFALPCGWDNTNYPAYSRVFVGALWNHRPDAIEITNAAATKWKLVKILDASPRRNAQDDAALALLTKRPFDITRLFIHKWRGDYNSGTNAGIQ